MLGHETRITGEVYSTPAGLTITARAEDEAAKSFSGSGADWDRLISQTAGQLYRQTQPYRYAWYLMRHDRAPEAEATFRDLFSSSNAKERAWAHLGLGFTLGQQNDDQAEVAQLRLALADDPDFALALADLSSAEYVLEHEGEALKAGEDFLRKRRDMGREVIPTGRLGFIHDVEGLDAFLVGDLPTAVAQATKVAQSRSALSDDGWLFRGAALGAEHDPAGARAAFDHLSAYERPDRLMALAASEGGGSVALARQVVADKEAQPNGYDYATRNDVPWLAVELARSGDLKGAQFAIASTPLDCDLCLRIRGEVASLAGDRKGADRWFARAIDRTSNLPWAYLARGRARFRSSDLDGALADARKIVHLSPHLADGYGLWGDVLARRRRWRAAKVKYEEALRYAPAWLAARRALGEVAARA